ncbi:c-type cytochrome [Verrucomicrobiaceae bacterium 5K15]|uniref:C-type cytochrome n=1 Tax=Oceaniferula flava TaxID=2800421 RepID=A0AAE2SAQ0_9BACT|nr:HEAT repeat domain-containing protein [Oceaniferula flavus]MBK1854194.1 c-type cytochrome [Oceaniferula flavus]MBM1135500.1 c-type cytochrome [Oceaniferula flavus]
MTFRHHLIFLSGCLSLSASHAAPTLVPSEALPQIKIAPDTKLKVFADHASQGVFSPTALTIDEKGRVLVAETWRFMDNRGIDDNRQRRYWIKEDIASQSTDDRLAMYQRWHAKHPPEHYTRHSEKIRILQDFNHDGVADFHHIFADQFNAPLDGTAAGIFSYNGDVYFACIPHIWLLKDKDGDGISDSRTSLQDGFGVRVSFSGHDLNGFAYGPDGRIYATIGDRGFNITTKEGRHYSYPGQGAVLRFEPDGSNMEVIHTGLRNPKEIAFDQFGNAITVDNNSDQGDRARVVYVMEGADSGWRMGHQVLHSFHRAADLEKRPINRWMQEKMWQTRNPSQPAYMLPPVSNLTSGPSGLTYHPGPVSYPGTPGHFLVCDYRGAAKISNILAFAVENDGAGMKVSEHYLFNQGAAVTDVDYGYDGKIYVSDFIGGWKTHQAGRVYTLSKKGSEHDTTIEKVGILVNSNFDEITDDKLTALLAYPDMRIRLRAQFAMARKQQPELFVAAFDGSDELLPRLHAIWGLGMNARHENQAGKKATAQLIAMAMQDHEEEIQSQIARCLGEAQAMEKRGLALETLLQNPSPRVQSFAAIALGKIKHRAAFSKLVQLLANNNDADAYLRHAGVMGLFGTAQTDQLLELKNHPSAAVRLAAVLTLRRHRSPEIAQFLSDRSQSVRDASIRAIHDLPIVAAQPSVAKLLPAFASDPKPSGKLTPMMQRRLVHSAFRVGGDANIRALLSYIGSTNPQVDLDQRREAVRLLGLWNTPPAIDQSLGRHQPMEKRSNKNLVNILQQDLPKLLTANSQVTAELLALSSHYRLKLDAIPASRLLSIARNGKINSKARTEALKSVAQNPPANFSEVLKKLIGNKDPQVAATALRLHSKHAKSGSATLIQQATDPGKPLILRQTAWSLAAASRDAAVQQHLATAVQQLTAGQGDAGAALEIIAAAESQQQAAVQQALAKYKESLDAQNPLSPYRITLHGGNATAGEAIFNSHPAAQCMRCHTTEKHHDVAMAGPNLSGLAKRGDRKFILESLVAPNAKVAKGFGTVSAMPPMGALLSKKEIRDLVAYLSTLK